jgi:hypothetical protein
VSTGPVDAPALAQQCDTALRAAIRAPQFEGLYAPDWWELPPGAPGTLGWKRAVLRRRIEGGAEHWGHLFLLTGPAGAELSLVAESTRLRPGPIAPATSLPVPWDGGIAVLWVRPGPGSPPGRLLELARATLDLWATLPR